MRMNPETWNDFDGNDYIVATSGDTCQQVGGEDVSAPRDQQVESIETSGTRETARLHNLGLKAALSVAFVSVVSVVILFAIFSIPSSEVYPKCRYDPSIEIVTTPTTDGYELEVGPLSRREGLPAYKVSVLKDDTPWSNMPVELTSGMEIKNAGGDEWLNFTDLTSDDMLTGGDFFTLEKLTSGSKYEVILLWAAEGNDCEITREVINVP